jgi:S-adenosylmethionine-diacylglycerol 3-amino-3-carboxypropyl transferase
MSHDTKGQVQLSQLIFTHNWEDPAVDERALRLQPGDTVLTITSGGCNTLGFLRFAPAHIYAVDINPAQTYVLELKKAVFKQLTHAEMTEFMGLAPCPDRQRLYEKIREGLPNDAQQYFDAKLTLIKKGLLMNGRYERFLKIMGRVLRLLQGRRKVEKLFTATTLAEQQTFYHQQWNNRRWRWIFAVLLNKKSLAKRGLNADYFHFDDGSSSFSESFHKRAAHALTDLPIAGNYFLSLYFLGKYTDRQQTPAYLSPEHFESIKAHINRAHAITADSKYWLEQQPDNFFDALALSNICELMDEADTHKLFQEVLRTAKPGARLIFRNLMIPREVPECFRAAIIKDEALSQELQFADRSFVYGKVAAYTVHK